MNKKKLKEVQSKFLNDIDKKTDQFKGRINTVNRIKYQIKQRKIDHMQQLSDFVKYVQIQKRKTMYDECARKQKELEAKKE